MNNKLKFSNKTFIWLFYIPLVYKNIKDFKLALKLVEEKKLKSICAFERVKTHPMNCFHFDGVSFRVCTSTNFFFTIWKLI